MKTFLRFCFNTSIGVWLGATAFLLILTAALFTRMPDLAGRVVGLALPVYFDTGAVLDTGAERRQLHRVPARRNHVVAQQDVDTLEPHPVIGRGGTDGQPGGFARMQADALEADRCTYGCLHVTTPKCRTDDLRCALGEEIMDAPCALKSSIATV